MSESQTVDRGDSFDAAAPKASRIRHVQQPIKASGCGPACVAMVAGVSFEAVVDLMWGRPKTRGFYTDYDDIKHALHELDVRTSPRAMRSTSFAQANQLSIFACLKRRNGGWHVVVYDPASGALYDPSEAEERPWPVHRLDAHYRPFSRLTVWPPDVASR